MVQNILFSVDFELFEGIRRSVDALSESGRKRNTFYHFSGRAFWAAKDILNLLSKA